MPVDVRVAYQVRMQLELQVEAVTNTLHDAFCDIIVFIPDTKRSVVDTRGMCRREL